MTEITRVPLQPIAQGSLGKIWLGVAVIALAAAGLASVSSFKSQTLDGGVKLVTLEAGDAEAPSPGAKDFVLVNYKGSLADGTVFDEGEQKPFQVNGVIPGLSEALQKMHLHGRYRVKIPADKGYGARDLPNIPANSDLNFEIDLLDVRSEAEVMQMIQMQQMQQMMQQQGGQGHPPLPPGATPANP